MSRITNHRLQTARYMVREYVIGFEKEVVGLVAEHMWARNECGGGGGSDGV